MTKTDTKYTDLVRKLRDAELSEKMILRPVGSGAMKMDSQASLKGVTRDDDGIVRNRSILGTRREYESSNTK